MFGLASASWVFTKLIKPIFGFIRQQGSSLFYYINASLIAADNFARCEQYAKVLVDLLEKLNFFVKRGKSVLLQSTIIPYLGKILQSVNFNVYLSVYVRICKTFIFYQVRLQCFIFINQYSKWIDIFIIWRD